MVWRIVRHRTLEQPRLASNCRGSSRWGGRRQSSHGDHEEPAEVVVGMHRDCVKDRSRIERLSRLWCWMLKLGQSLEDVQMIPATYTRSTQLPTLIATSTRSK